MRVAELEFSDIYLGEKEAWLSASASPEGTAQVPGEAMPDAMRLREACAAQEAALGMSEFSLEFDGVTYRVSKMVPLHGTVYVLRRMPASVPAMESLRINEDVVKALLEPNLTGLVLIAGQTGQGKTTTASAMVVERVKRYGGIAIAAEDPPEMPLEGFHEKGVCYQVWASRERGGFPEVSRQVVRWKPNIILLGELRDAETAEEAMKASINGHLVIATIHADTVPGALQRVHSLVKEMDPESAAKLLSEGISAVMVQKLVHVSAVGVLPQVQFLDFDAEDSGKGARTYVRSMQWQMLDGEVQHQENVRSFNRLGASGKSRAA